MKLYKYVSARLAKKFIEKPMLRLSPAFSLNDPFEINLPRDVLNEIKGKIKAGRENEFECNLNGFMLSHGIISLSETKQSLLMWSHYADEHRGFVVEIEVEKGNEIFALNGSDMPRYSDSSFSKVEYKKDRILPFKLTPETLKQARAHYYKTKFIDWEYEKECRFILPFSSATTIQLNTNNCKYKSIIDSLGLTTCEINGDIRNIDLDSLQALWVLEGKSLYLLNNILLDIWLDSERNGAVFLVELCSEAISHLYIGAKADIESFDRYFQEFNESNVNYYSPLIGRYSKVSQAKLNLNNFSIDFEAFKSPE